MIKVGFSFFSGAFVVIAIAVMSLIGIIIYVIHDAWIKALFIYIADRGCMSFSSVGSINVHDG